MVNISVTRPARGYRSPVRRKQAEQTRSRIIAAARWLFARRGYAETTIEAIAERAGVSSQTIYTAFGSKTSVLAALLESLVASVRHDELPVGVMTNVDQLRRCARMARRIYDALRDALQAVRVAEGLASELAEVVRAREDARFASLSGVIETLSSQGGLAQHLDSAAAHDLLWSLTGPEMYRLLVVDRGWSPERYEAQLGDLLIRSILG